MARTFNGKPVKFTKNGQPYIVKADGKALFVKRAAGDPPLKFSKKGKSTVAKKAPKAKKSGGKARTKPKVAKTMAKKRGKKGGKKAKNSKSRSNRSTLGKFVNALTDPMLHGVAAASISAFDGYRAGVDMKTLAVASGAMIGAGLAGHTVDKTLGYGQLVGGSLSRKGKLCLAAPLGRSVPLILAFKEVGFSKQIFNTALRYETGVIAGNDVGVSFDAAKLMAGGIPKYGLYAVKKVAAGMKLNSMLPKIIPVGV